MARLVRILVATTCAVVATMATTAGPAAAGEAARLPRQYRAVPLVGVDGERAGAFAMNDSGQVVSQFETAGRTLHPFRWERGRMTDLGVLESGPGERGMARDINARGDVVGSSDRGGRQRAVLWRRGHIVDLGDLGSGSSYASAINDRGEIAGSITDWTSEPISRAVRWQRGKMAFLGSLPGGNASGAAAINEHGVILGSGNVVPFSADEHAFLYSRGTLRDLSMAGVPAEVAHGVHDINNRGQLLIAATLYIPVRAC